MQKSPIKCRKCDKDAVVVERATFYFCADCWLEDNPHRKGKRKNEKSFRVS